MSPLPPFPCPLWGEGRVRGYTLSEEGSLQTAQPILESVQPTTRTGLRALSTSPLWGGGIMISEGVGQF